MAPRIRHGLGRLEVPSFAWLFQRLKSHSICHRAASKTRASSKLSRLLGTFVINLVNSPKAKLLRLGVGPCFRPRFLTGARRLAATDEGTRSSNNRAGNGCSPSNTSSSKRRWLALVPVTASSSSDRGFPSGIVPFYMNFTIKLIPQTTELKPIPQFQK